MATRDPDVPAWIAWPVRAVAVVTVVPLRLLWELFVIVGRFVGRYVVRPIAWLLYHAIVRPMSWLYHYAVVVPLSWLWRTLVVAPLSWLWRHLVVPPIAWLWERREPIGRFLRRYLGRPVGWVLYHLLLLPLYWLVKYLLVVPMTWLVQALKPIGRAIAAVARVLYRFVLRPFGQAAAWLWHNTVRLLAAVFRATVVPVARWTYHTLLAPGGRWVRDSVLRPAGTAVRAVLIALGLRRAR